MRDARIIAVAHLKGGTGATTVAVNLAAELAASRHSTLLIDMDPVAASTFHLLAETPERTMFDVLENYVHISTAALPTAQDGLSIVPAGPALSAWDRRPERLPVVLSRVLSDAAKLADVVLLDLPPSSRSIIRGTFAVLPGGRVLAPIQARTLDLVGFQELVKVVNEMREQNAALHIAGIVPTRMRPAALCRDVVDALVAENGRLVLQSIREALPVARVPITHKPLRVAYPGSPANEDFQRLARDVVSRVLRG